MSGTISIQEQAILNYERLEGHIKIYSSSLENLGYEKIEGGNMTRDYSPWSFYCHPDYLKVIKGHFPNLPFVYEYEVKEFLREYMGVNKLPFGILMPCPLN